MEQTYALIKNGIVENIIVGYIELEGYTIINSSYYNSILIGDLYDSNLETITTINGEIYTKNKIVEPKILTESDILELELLKTGGII